MSLSNGIRENTVEEMFVWWSKQKIKKKPHLRIVNKNSHARITALAYSPKKEIEWMKTEIIRLTVEIDVMEEQDYHKQQFNVDLYELKNFKRSYELKLKGFKKNPPKPRATEQIINIKQFKEILLSFNSKVKERIVLDGSVVNIKNRMGYLSIQKVKRGFHKYPDEKNGNKSYRCVNWKASMTLKNELIADGVQIKNEEHPEGKKWLIFYTDPFYLRYNWTKTGYACRVKNHGYYKFVPSGDSKKSRRSAKGFLFQSNTDNRVLHMKYNTKKLNKTNAQLRAEKLKSA